MEPMASSKARANRILTPISLGPWPLGLNNRDSIYSNRDIAENQLSTCINFDIRENGVLVSRPGVVIYSPDLFHDLTGDAVDLTFKNVVGSVRIDAAYDEGVIQAADPVNRNMYLFRTAISDGRSSDFAPGYWVKQAWVAASEFYITSLTRYDDEIYFVTNNDKVSSESAFVGGFKRSVSGQTVTNRVDSNSYSFDDTDTDSAGNLWGVLRLDNKLVKISPAGVATEVDVSATITHPAKITINKTTNDMYVSTSLVPGNIYKVTSAGVISTIYSGTSVSGGTGSDANGDYNIWTRQSFTNLVWRSSDSKLIVELDTNLVHQYTSGALSGTTVTVSVTVTLEQLTTGGVLTQINTTSISSTYFQKMTIDSNGIVYAVYNSSYILFEGTDVGDNLFTWLNLSSLGVTSLTDITIDSNDNLYVVDSLSKVWKVTPAKVASVYTTLSESKNIAMTSDDTLIADSTATHPIYEITPPSDSLTAVTTIPFGDISFILKDRMFVVNKSSNRVYYSKSTDPTLWDSVDGGGFFDVEPGDGLDINDVAIVNDQVFIFKSTKTFVFTFTSDPGTDGSLRILSTDRGAYSAITYNNIIYIVGPQGIQHILNGYFLDISQQIKSLHDYISENSTISVYDNRLIVSINNNTDINMLVMNLLTGAWTTWNSFPGGADTEQLQNVGRLYTVGDNKAVYQCETSTESKIGGLNTTSGLDNNIASAISSFNVPMYSLKTKIYDFNTPLLWKKMQKLSSDIGCNFSKWSPIYVNDTVDIIVHLFSPTQEDTPDYLLDTSGADTDRKFPYLVVPNVGYSTFRFQTMYIEVTLNEANSGVEPDVENGRPLLIIRGFNGYIMQKASKGEPLDAVT